MAAATFFAALLAVAGCLDDSLAPAARGEARLNIRTVVSQVSPGAQSAVAIAVGYYRSDESLVSLPVTPSRVSVALGSTAEQPIVVKLDDCLADPERMGSGGEGCYLEVTLTLLDASGEEISSESQFAEIPVTPGGTMTFPAITLSDVETVEISPIDTLFVGDTVTALATAKWKSGTVVQNPSFSWLSFDPFIASVDSASGLITALGPGTTYLNVTAGQRSAIAMVVVRPTS